MLDGSIPALLILFNFLIKFFKFFFVFFLLFFSLMFRFRLRRSFRFKGLDLEAIPVYNDLASCYGGDIDSLSLGPTPEIGASVGYLLATGGTDNLVKLWRIKQGKDAESELNISEYTKLEGHSQNVMCISFTPTGHLLASGYGVV